MEIYAAVMSVWAVVATILAIVFYLVGTESIDSRIAHVDMLKEQIADWKERAREAENKVNRIEQAIAGKKYRGEAS